MSKLNQADLTPKEILKMLDQPEVIDFIEFIAGRVAERVFYREQIQEDYEGCPFGVAEMGARVEDLDVARLVSRPRGVGGLMAVERLVLVA